MVRMWCFAACFSGVKNTPIFSDLFFGLLVSLRRVWSGRSAVRACANAHISKSRYGAPGLRGRTDVALSACYFVACVFDGAG